MANRLELLSVDEKRDLITAIAQDQHAKARELWYGNGAEQPTATPSEKDENKEGHRLSPEKKEGLLNTLELRFAANNGMFPKLHPDIKWEDVKNRLNSIPEKKLWSLGEMERTGGEPDVVGFDEQTGEYIWRDCVLESPPGRRNVCYDLAGQQEAEKRGDFFNGNAVDLAEQMGTEILDEAGSRELAEQCAIGKNTWNLVATPPATRGKGRVLVCMKGAERVNVCAHMSPSQHNHNTGFRTSLRT